MTFFRVYADRDEIGADDVGFNRLHWLVEQQGVVLWRRAGVMGTIPLRSLNTLLSYGTRSHTMQQWNRLRHPPSI